MCLSLDPVLTSLQLTSCAASRDLFRAFYVAGLLALMGDEPLSLLLKLLRAALNFSSH